MSDRKEGVYQIKSEKLILDQNNPRLYGESVVDSQEQIMQRIYSREQIDELASSLAVNGYFEEEPIIVIPENVNDFDNINSSNFNDFNYIVIEGNRRTTSVKLLLTPDNNIVDSDFPIVLPEKLDSLKQLPAIIYKNREDVDIYLSVRHISGHRKWDAFAKAKYIYDKVNKINEERGDISNSINFLSTQIGDQNNVVKKNYVYYKIFKEVEDDVINYSSKHIKERFSLFEVALASGNTTIAKYIGIPAFRNINLENELVQPEKIDELKNVTEWIFGKDEQGNGSLISDSRQISKFLKPILGNPDATEHLETYNDLEGALQLTDGEEQFVIGNVRKANKLLVNIFGKVRNHKDKLDFKAALEELQDSIENLKSIINR
jgi:hypothetical protein